MFAKDSCYTVFRWRNCCFPYFFCIILLLNFVFSFSLQSAVFKTIDFQTQANTRMQDRIALPQGLTGNQVFGDVPFFIPSQGLNAWGADLVFSTFPKVLTLDVNIMGATAVDTLMNTYWGQSGPESYVSIEFFGTNGAYFKKKLIGNEDIRDYNQSASTNTINGTTTTQVAAWNAFGSGQRLDKQKYILPDGFHSETLTTIKITDTGDEGFQHVFLAGLTVTADVIDSSAVPEPQSIILLLCGLLLIYVFRLCLSRSGKKTV